MESARVNNLSGNDSATRDKKSTLNYCNNSIIKALIINQFDTSAINNSIKCRFFSIRKKHQ